MDEILYELREHAAGPQRRPLGLHLQLIKTLPRRPGDGPARPRRRSRWPCRSCAPTRSCWCATCHRRGAHAIGGMSAFIPNRREPEVTANALAKVREDKEREAGDGFDGTWVAHPDLVPVAMAESSTACSATDPNQKDRLRDDVPVIRGQLLDIVVPGGRSPRPACATNVSVALHYLDSWLRGNGAAAIDNLMEDAATAEISRSQLWQWRRHRTPLDDGGPFDDARYAPDPRRGAGPDRPRRRARRRRRRSLLDDLVLGDDFAEFLTLAAYPPPRLSQRIGSSRRSDEPRRSPRRPDEARRHGRRTRRERSSERTAPAPPCPRRACSRWCGGGRPRARCVGPPGRTGRCPRPARPRSRPCRAARTGARASSRAGPPCARRVIRPARDAPLVDDRQQRLDARRAVRDLGRTARASSLLDGERDRARGRWRRASSEPSAEPVPQRVAVGGRAERRRDHVAIAASSGGSS